MAISKTVVGVVGAVALGVGTLVASVAGRPPSVDSVVAAKRRVVPKDAKHLWTRQPDGGTGLRDPLPTLNDGGCQAWAQRCGDRRCAMTCE